MTTMLPMGLREDIKVSTTSFSPWARLMTLESRGEVVDAQTLPARTLPPTLTVVCPPSMPCRSPLFTEPPPRGLPPSAVPKQAPTAPTAPPPLSG